MTENRSHALNAIATPEMVEEFARFWDIRRPKFYGFTTDTHDRGNYRARLVEMEFAPVRFTALIYITSHEFWMNTGVNQRADLISFRLQNACMALKNCVQSTWREQVEPLGANWE